MKFYLTWHSSRNIEKIFNLKDSKGIFLCLENITKENVSVTEDIISHDIINSILKLDKEYTELIKGLSENMENDAKLLLLKDKLKKEVIDDEIINIIISHPNCEIDFFSCHLGDSKCIEKNKNKLLKLIK